MALQDTNVLKRVLRELTPATPVDSDWLRERGVSRQLAYHYVRSGWLERLAPGVYALPSHGLSLDPSLRLLMRLGHPFHVGGKTALSWFGYRHNVAPTSELVTLFRHEDGSRTLKLPLWFTSRFRCRVATRALFSEAHNTVRLLLTENSAEHLGVLVSEPERAVLEMLSEVPKWQGLEEAEHLMEGMTSLRADSLRRALMACKNVKTVRLFLHFATTLNLPSAKALTTEELPTGSKSRYVRKLPHGTLILKP